MSGWIKLHRQLLDNPIYTSDSFSRGQAWIDLLLLANHKEGYFFKRGIKVTVSVGQVGYDIDSLAKRWQWSRGKVERFISHLENEGNVVRQKNNVTTLLSIVKYSEYQADSKPKDKPRSNSNGHQTVNQTNTNKNEKNDNNENNDKEGSFDFVFFQFKEMRKKINKPLTAHAEKLLLLNLEKLSGGNEQMKIDILNQSIVNCWQGVFELKKPTQLPPQSLAHLREIK